MQARKGASGAAAQRHKGRWQPELSQLSAFTRADAAASLQQQQQSDKEDEDQQGPDLGPGLQSDDDDGHQGWGFDGDAGEGYEGEDAPPLWAPSGLMDGNEVSAGSTC